METRAGLAAAPNNTLLGAIPPRALKSLAASIGWVSAVDSEAEQSGLLTRIAAMEGATLCERMKS